MMRRSSRSLETPMDASQLAGLDGRKTVARRSLERSAPGGLRGAAGPAEPGQKARPRPPSRRSSRDTVRGRLSNLGPHPGQLQPILSGRPFSPGDPLAGLRIPPEREPPPGNPYLALLAAADTLADAEAAQSPPNVETQLAPVAPVAAEPDPAASAPATAASAPEPLPVPDAPAASAAQTGQPTCAASESAEAAHATAAAATAAAAAGGVSAQSPPALEAKPSISRSSDEIWKEVSKGLHADEPAQPSASVDGSSTGGSTAQNRRRDVRPLSPFATHDEPFVAAGAKQRTAQQAAGRQERRRSVSNAKEANRNGDSLASISAPAAASSPYAAFLAQLDAVASQQQDSRTGGGGDSGGGGSLRTASAGAPYRARGRYQTSTGVSRFQAQQRDQRVPPSDAAPAAEALQQRPAPPAAAPAPQPAATPGRAVAEGKQQQQQQQKQQLRRQEAGAPQARQPALRRVVSDGAAALGAAADIAAQTPPPPAADPYSAFHLAADELLTSRQQQGPNRLDSGSTSAARARRELPVVAKLQGRERVPARGAAADTAAAVAPGAPQTPFMATRQARASAALAEQLRERRRVLMQGSNMTRSASGSALRSVSRPEIPGAELPLPSGIASRTIAALSAAAASEDAMAVQSLRTNTGSTQSSRAASLSSVSSIGSPVASAANPYALFALRPEPKTLARFSTGASAIAASRRGSRSVSHASLGSVSSLRSGSGGGALGSLLSGGAASRGSSISGSPRWGDNPGDNPFVRLSNSNNSLVGSPERPSFLEWRQGSGERTSASSAHVAGLRIPEEEEAAAVSFSERHANAAAADVFLQVAGRPGHAAGPESSQLSGLGSPASSTKSWSDGEEEAAAAAAPVVAAVSSTKSRSASSGGDKARLWPRGRGGRKQEGGGAAAVDSPYSMFALPPQPDGSTNGPSCPGVESREASFELRPRVSTGSRSSRTSEEYKTSKIKMRAPPPTAQPQAGCNPYEQFSPGAGGGGGTGGIPSTVPAPQAGASTKAVSSPYPAFAPTSSADAAAAAGHTPAPSAASPSEVFAAGSSGGSNSGGGLRTPSAASPYEAFARASGASDGFSRSSGPGIYAMFSRPSEDQGSLATTAAADAQQAATAAVPAPAGPGLVAVAAGSRKLGPARGDVRRSSLKKPGQGMPMSPFARDCGDKWELQPPAAAAHPGVADSQAATVATAPVAVHSLDSGMAARSKAQLVADSTRVASSPPRSLRRGRVRVGAAAKPAAKPASGDDSDGSPRAARGSRPEVPDPVKLKGKQRQEALAAAEAAAERELAVLISDNSMTWDL